MKRKRLLNTAPAIWSGKSSTALVTTVLVLMLAGSWLVVAPVSANIMPMSNKVKIDVHKQQELLIIEREKCMQLAEQTPNVTGRCPVFWDEIMCWPQTEANKTVSLLCPNYVDMFNIKNQATKHCGLMSQPDHQAQPQVTNAFWSRTNFSSCLQDSVDEHLKVVEVHVEKIILIRVLGYCVSMLSLLTAILILFIPKLRCPRNYLHINLFVVIMVRIILVITVDKIMRNNFSQLLEMNELYGNLNIKANIQCKLMIAIFRYSGSVYYVGIFSEALYLVLLLKYPYYDEKKSLLVCLITTWFLPLLWIIPWICVKALKDNYWCWQTMSPYSLIIKVPHSMLLVANIGSTVYILKVLYSKIQSNTLSREKILKYRRLAKSLLILIPLFGLHFVIFAWLPYARVIKFNPDLEITTAYAETVMKSFQGFVVSIACCFMNFDVRVELILFVCEQVKKMKCLGASCLVKYLESDYVNRLKYKQSSRHRNGTSSVLVKSGITHEGDLSRSNHSDSIMSESQQVTQRSVTAPTKQYDETSQLLDRVASTRGVDDGPNNMHIEIEFNETEFSSGDSNATVGLN